VNLFIIQDTRLEKYESQEKTFQDRNSYSKTDPDATFMRMKGDIFGKSQPKAGYNIQLGTENQFILGYTTHQSPTDRGLFTDHLNNLKENTGKLPKNVVTDAGYGSERNYEYLERNNIGNYVKYSTFQREQKKSFKEQVFRKENLAYDTKKDEYTCPIGKKLRYKGIRKQQRDKGIITEFKVYRCNNCLGFGHRADCNALSRNREIRIQPGYEMYKKQATSNLKSEKGVKLRKRRGIEVESVFGMIKQNMGFRRFYLRGLKKVHLEWGLINIAHNLKKLYACC
jgi:hypothetical protein